MPAWGCSGRGLEGVDEFPGLEDVVLDRAVTPAAVPAKRVDVSALQLTAYSRTFMEGSRRQMDVGGIEHDGLVCHELLRGADDAVRAQLVEYTRQEIGCRGIRLQ